MACSDSIKVRIKEITSTTGSVGAESGRINEADSDSIHSSMSILSTSAPLSSTCSTTNVVACLPSFTRPSSSTTLSSVSPIPLPSSHHSFTSSHSISSNPTISLSLPLPLSDQNAHTYTDMLPLLSTSSSSDALSGPVYTSCPLLLPLSTLPVVAESSTSLTPFLSFSTMATTSPTVNTNMPSSQPILSVASQPGCITSFSPSSTSTSASSITWASTLSRIDQNSNIFSSSSAMTLTTSVVNTTSSSQTICPVSSPLDVSSFDPSSLSTSASLTSVSSSSSNTTDARSKPRRYRKPGTTAQIQYHSKLLSFYVITFSPL